MFRVHEAIIVEGRYDQIRLSSLLDATVIETNGFRIFKDDEKMSLIRRLAVERGIVVLTDSDAAGFVIRDRISAAVPKEQLRHAYIAPVKGKESRKRAPSKEGLLGVEGMRNEELLAALRTAGVLLDSDAPTATPFLTHTRLFEDGLTGHAGSKTLREALCRELSLPTYLSTARLMEVLNVAFSEEEYLLALDKARL